jgi:endonuclease/exonuclease/phosphatase family metal-dependent hydrolase
MKTRSPKNVAFCLVVFYFITTVSISSCTPPIPIPPKDETPPTVSLDLNTNRGIISAAGLGTDQKATIFFNDEIDFIISGQDNDGGVKRISIIYDITLSCGNLQTGLGTSQTFSKSVDATDLSPASTGPTMRLNKDSWLVSDQINSCGQESTFREFKFSAHAEAENYNGGIARTGSISFSITPFLRVATFNLHSSADAPLSRAGLLAEEADVVLLQEVDGEAQATDLATMSGLNNVHYYESLAIISRYPLNNIVEYPIPNIADNRYVLEATITVDGKSIRLMDSHFSHDSDYVGFRENLRVISAQYILSLVAQTPTTSTIFSADLNSVRGSPPVDVLLTKFRDASIGAQIPASTQCSFPGIDFVLVRGFFQTLSFESVCPAPHPSDHPFVWVAFAYAP